MIKSRIWYLCIYRFFWWIFKIWLPLKFNIKAKAKRINHTPYLVVSNHVCFWDPMLVALGLTRQMFFVSSEQVLRSGLKGKALVVIMDPIPRAKSVTEIQTVIKMYSRIRQGYNICIFPEGTITTDGETAQIRNTTGKFIKKARCSLVTTRFTGGYLTYPRWARFKRRGVMKTEVVNVYPAEQIAAMSIEEINAIVSRDIYVNAFEDQKKNPIAFRGKNLAEWLETVLYFCPKCLEYSKLVSRDDRFFCECGFHIRYTEYGFFEYPPEHAPSDKNEQPPFTTILEWSQWQSGKIKALAESLGNHDPNVPIFTDHNQDLYLVERASRGILLGSGIFNMYPDKVTFVENSGKTTEIPFEHINDMAIFANRVLVFSTADKNLYEVRSELPTCVLKYMEMFRLLKGDFRF